MNADTTSKTKTGSNVAKVMRAIVDLVSPARILSRIRRARMRRTRRERKAYEQGRAAGYTEGYAEGYAKGLHDGNPFIVVAEAMANAVNMIAENLRDPEFEDILEIEEGGGDDE